MTPCTCVYGTHVTIGTAPAVEIRGPYADAECAIICTHCWGERNGKADDSGRREAIRRYEAVGKVVDARGGV